MSVSKRDYPYPPDEFDQIDPAERPKEVHAAKRSAWSRTWPFLLVVILVPAAAIVAVKFLSAPSNQGTNGQNTTSPPAVTQPTDQPTEQPTETTIEPTIEPTEEPPTVEPTLPVDYGTTVTVMNDVSNAFPGTRNQLAARTAARLITAGFTEATASTNHVQNERPTSQVYFGSPEDKATAEAVAEAVGIVSVQEDAEVAATGIVVSLGDDFREV